MVADLSQSQAGESIITGSLEEKGTIIKQRGIASRQYLSHISSVEEKVRSVSASSASGKVGAVRDSLERKWNSSHSTSHPLQYTRPIDRHVHLIVSRHL
ncbi:hypothetical protein J6590_058460 [Homalodisca vitripennis]|nr:hypothetical protein J6590_058460 [Homalodisca vitripennis]